MRERQSGTLGRLLESATRLATMLMVAVPLVACFSADEPTEAEAMPYVERDLAEYFVKPYSVTSFRKTNGAAANFGGMQIYEMQYEVIISYPNNDLRCQMPLCPGLSTRYNVKKDKERKLVTLYGSMNFRKTERGWQP